MTRTWATFSARWATLGQARERRVFILLIGVVVMSMGDLFMTLTHLKGPGMLEANPLARGIMGYNSALGLTLWKCLTLSLGIGILIWARRTVAGEVGAWICCLALTWLTFQWHTYNHRASELTPYVTLLAEGGDVRWMRMKDP